MTEPFIIGPDVPLDEWPEQSCFWCGRKGKGPNWQMEVITESVANGPNEIGRFWTRVWCGECPKIMAPRQN